MLQEDLPGMARMAQRVSRDEVGIERALLDWKPLGGTSELSMLPGCKIPHPRARGTLGDPHGPPWGDNSQEKGLQVHREGSARKQEGMW